MTARTFFIALFTQILALGLLSTAQAQQPAQTPSTPPPGQNLVAPSGIGENTSSAYVLGRDDVVEVGLLGRTDFGGRARVQADGTIQLPYIGKVPAADRTTSQLSDSVRTSLKAGGFFADPVVTVEVVGYSSRYVVVLGAVGSPGLVPINRPYRVSEVLARVGGVRDGAADYLVLRPEKGEEKRLLVRELATGDVKQDPFVQAGDKLFVPMAETFYIYGKVNAPGAYALQTDMTVRQAIARGGGLGESGSDKKVTVTRGGQKVSLKLDDKVQSGDVLVIGERLF